LQGARQPEGRDCGAILALKSSFSLVRSGVPEPENPFFSL
jgi:hypothetical protein